MDYSFYMQNTSSQYTKVMEECLKIFRNKTKDYGTTWRNFRPSSLTDQIYIKTKRIRTIQETGENKVGESIDDAFQAIINYCIMALIQLRYDEQLPMELSEAEAVINFSKVSTEAHDLMANKNHDYGEAWRDMRVSSLVDFMMVKIARIKKIEDNRGQTIASEGVEGNYLDILNYAVFALIHLNEQKDEK